MLGYTITHCSLRGVEGIMIGKTAWYYGFLVWYVITKSVLSGEVGWARSHRVIASSTDKQRFDTGCIRYRMNRIEFDDGDESSVSYTESESLFGSHHKVFVE
ncbi:hypothetical protein GOBAR_AA09144 [Gossypium barbadense]|uniref:Uncharacterized protein n=1 Tax=Gossypium barbadense TaxID=3634 RepID=A0A2P5Y7D0_GOSBA|nr:hypothetical protein GOBAR_AA09144 [Gossypium barbadense]